MLNIILRRFGIFLQVNLLLGLHIEKGHRDIKGEDTMSGGHFCGTEINILAGLEINETIILVGETQLEQIVVKLEAPETTKWFRLQPGYPKRLGDWNEEEKKVLLEKPSNSLGGIVELLIKRGFGKAHWYQFHGSISVPLIHKNDTLVSLFTFPNNSMVINPNFPYAMNQEYKLIIPNEMWFGCPVDRHCLRFFIDDATKIEENKALLFMGRYVYTISSLTNQLKDEVLIDDYFKRKIPYFVDAVFMDRQNGIAFIIKEHRMWLLASHLNKWTMVNETAVFAMFETEMLTTAGISLTTHAGQQMVYIFEDNAQVAQYYMHGNLSADLKASKTISEINKNLPSQVDAVFTDPESDQIFIIKNNYILNISKELFWNEISSSNFTSVFDLFGCPLHELSVYNITDADRVAYFWKAFPYPHSPSSGRMKPFVDNFHRIERILKNDEYHIWYFIVFVLASLHLVAIGFAYLYFSKPHEAARPIQMAVTPEVDRMSSPEFDVETK